MLFGTRTKHAIAIIKNHEIIFMGKKILEIVEAMQGFEVSFVSRQKLSEHLNTNGFYIHVTKSGEVYEVIKYDNPKYKPQKRKSKNA